MPNLAALVAQAYPSPQWAVFYEVANATGFGARRHADAVALGIWPSRGHQLVGFEFKASRRDWQRELRQPAKAEEIARFCDEWWLVVSDDRVAKLEEIPEPWGLLVATPKGDKLERRKLAKPFPDREKTALPRSFVAAMLRRVGETTIPRELAGQQLAAAVDAAKGQPSDPAIARELEDTRRSLERHREAIREFQTATGIDLLHGYQGPGQLSKAVQAVIAGDGHRHALELSKQRFEQIVASIAAALATWPPSPAVPLPLENTNDHDRDATLRRTGDEEHRDADRAVLSAGGT